MLRVLAIGLTLAFALPASALAEGTGKSLPPVKKTITVAKAKRASCLVNGVRRGRAATTYKAPLSGYLTVRLAAARGDWDLTVLKGERGFGASQGFKAREVVQGWVQAGDVLTVRGCRRSGSARKARLTMSLMDVAPPKAGETPKLLRVNVGSQKRMEQLERMGVDVTHNQDSGAADVIVAGPNQLKALDQAGFKHRTLIDDLGEHYLRSRRADARRAARTVSPLPSGRETYRDYADYGAELKALAENNRTLVKGLSIGRSYQGRELSGVEIAKDVHKEDGRPVYFMVALHHAREWPSAESAMEFAHMLVKGADSNPRIKALLENARTVIVPLINPDGFIASRRAAPVDPASNLSDQGINPSIPIFGDPTTAEGVAPPGGILSYRRKNCAGDIPNPATPCELQWGIDPNRNYGEGWGGPGSSPEAFSQSYHGPGPWSEPETQAVHEFSAKRQVTTIMTIHNVAALVLRPPGTSKGGMAPDEVRLKEVGDAIADATGYRSQFGFQLYDTSGTTEDWNYAAQGAYGYTIEIGPKNGEFHMPYKTGVIDQWTGAYAGEGKGGLAEAYLIAGEAAANPADHSVITGSAPKGAKLSLTKEFNTYSAGGYCRRGVGIAPFNFEPECIDGPHEEPIEIDDKLETTMVTAKNGGFEWHVNPSTRPFVGWRAKIETGDTPTSSETLVREKTTQPNPGLPVSGVIDSSEDREFTVGDGIARLEVLVEVLPEDDYDIELFYKAEDGSLEEIDSSGGSAGADESIKVANPQPGTYVLRVNNWSATGEWKALITQFAGQFVLEDLGVRESWTLTCEVNGQVAATRQVQVDRGQTADVGRLCGKK